MSRAECGGKLILGRCTTLDNLPEGPNIFSTEAVQTEQKDIVSFCKYSLVTLSSIPKETTIAPKLKFSPRPMAMPQISKIELIKKMRSYAQFFTIHERNKVCIHVYLLVINLVYSLLEIVK